MKLPAELSKFVAANTQYPDTSYHEFLADLVLECGARTVLEVGVNTGSSMLALLFAMKSLGGSFLAYGIDDEQQTPVTEVVLTMRRWGFGDHVCMITGKDVDEMPKLSVKLDLIHLDASHTTEGVLRELHLASVLEPQIIVVHDLIDPRVTLAADIFSQVRGIEVERNKKVYNGCAIFRLEDE